MRVRLKLVVIVVFVALVPLAVSAVTALRIHGSAYDAVVDDQQRATARHAARVVRMWLADAERSLGALAGQIPWVELDDDELRGALSLVYEQLGAVAAVQLIDADGGGVGAAMYLPPGDSRLPRHPRASLKQLEALAASAPASRRGFGAPLAEPGQPPRLALAVPLGADDRDWMLLIGLSLGPLCAELDDRGELRVALLDADGDQLCPPDARAGQRHPAAGVGVGQLARFSGGGREQLGAAAVTSLGWRVVAYQPASVAGAPARRMRQQTMFWIAASVIIALVAGLVLARGITRPVAALSAGADELARGNLAHRIAVDGGDELAELAATFNHMGGEIQRRDDEIRAWNEELQHRVDERTRELKEAQGQLLQSQKLAAVSSLAAGVAHEINNPLTGVLGMAQLLEGKAADAQKPALEAIVREARRIRDIVQTLQQLSREGGEGHAAVQLDDLARAAVEVMAPRAEGGEVAMSVRAPQPVRVWGIAAQLREVLLHVLDNALNATPSGGRVDVSVRTVEGELAVVEVRDTGKGIPPENLARIYEPFFSTKDDWQGRGLGLTVAYRLVEAHSGTIKVDSEVGQGTTVTVTLPAGRRGAHLT